MRDGQEFEINGTAYFIHEANGGWHWSDRKFEGDTVATPLEALQSAIDREYQDYHHAHEEVRHELTETLSASWR